MKKKSGMNYLVPRMGVGAALLALLAFTPASHASIIVDNLPGAGGAGTYSTAGATTRPTNPTGAYYAEEFTVSGAVTLGSVTLDLDFSAAGSSTVSLYELVNGTGTYTLLGNLGTVSSAGANGSDLVSITGLNNSLTTLVAGTHYAIALDSTSSSIEWNDTSTLTSAGGTGALGNQVIVDPSSSRFYAGNNSIQLQMELTSVPEVPMTGAFMGFGALAIVGGSALRRKLSAAKTA